MKHLCLILAVVVFARHGLAEEPREGIGLREFLYSEGFATHAKTNETCYISFGSDGDPPDEFLKRFSGTHFTVKKISARPNAMQKPLPKNPKTGAPDATYTVEIVQWLNETTARVTYSMRRDLLWAAGYTAIAEKKDGKWRIKQYLTHWVS